MPQPDITEKAIGKIPATISLLHHPLIELLQKAYSAEKAASFAY